MKKILLCIILLISGCTPLINVSINSSTAGVDPKHSIKGESDAQATSKGSLGVGVGPGAQTSAGSVK